MNELFRTIIAPLGDEIKAGYQTQFLIIEQAKEVAQFTLDEKGEISDTYGLNQVQLVPGIQVTLRAGSSAKYYRTTVYNKCEATSFYHN